jgi:carbon storage regulator
MLVLSRKTNQKIVINDDIIVTIISVQGNKVRIGIEAPQNVTVHRSEVLEAIKAEAAAVVVDTAASPLRKVS